MFEKDLDMEEVIDAMLDKYPAFGTVLNDVKIKYTKKVPTAATDGSTIYVNKEFLRSKTPDERVFILAHETLHIALNHLSRAKDRDPMSWNYATDAVINERLVKDGLKAPDGVIRKEGALDRDAEDVYNEVHADRMKRQQEKQKQAEQNQQNQNQNGQQGQNGQEQGQNGQQGQDGQSQKADGQQGAENQQGGQGQSNGQQNNSTPQNSQQNQGGQQNQQGQQNQGGQQGQGDQQQGGAGGSTGQQDQQQSGQQQSGGQSGGQQNNQSQDGGGQGGQQGDQEKQQNNQNQNGNGSGGNGEQQDSQQQGGSGGGGKHDASEEHPYTEDDYDQFGSENGDNGDVKDDSQKQQNGAGGGAGGQQKDNDLMDKSQNGKQGGEQGEKGNKDSDLKPQSQSQEDDPYGNIFDTDNQDMLGHDDHSMWSKVQEKKKEGKGDEKDPEEKEQGYYSEKDFFEENDRLKEEKAREIIERVRSRSRGLEGATTDFSLSGIGKGDRAVTDWRKLLRTSVEKEEERWGHRFSDSGNNWAARIEDYELDERAESEIIIDTSGSVSPDLVRAFLRQTKTILKDSDIKIGMFSTDFYGWTEIKSEKDIDNLTFHGGGGTNFDAASRAFSKKKMVNHICLTDGEDGGDAGIREKRNDIIWVCYGNPKFKPDKGRVIYVAPEDIMRGAKKKENVRTY